MLELLGRGLGQDIGEYLDRYYWAPPRQSVQELRTECREHPDWPDAQLRLGLVLLRGGELDEAAGLLGNAIRQKPDYLAARLALAAALTEQGQIERAMEQLKLANQTHPGKVPVLFAIGFCLEQLGRAEQAAEYYRDAVAGDGSFRPARERLAAIEVVRGNDGAAIEQYLALRQECPEESWIRSALAHLYYRVGQYGQSIEEFETAIAMEPENWALRDDEVEVLVADGQIREAIARLHSLLEDQEEFADLHVRLGDLYGKCGDDTAAMKHYRRAMEISPSYLEAHVKTGTQHLCSGRWEEAAEEFCRASELNDGALVNYVGMGVAQAAMGDTAAALNSLELAAAIEPNSTLLLTEMAKLQLKAAVAESFLRNFEAGKDVPVAEIDLDNDDLLNKQADRHAEEVQQHPNHADLRYRYGVLLRAQGRLGEAIEQFAKAVELNPTYVQAIIKLGVTQQDLGMTQEAVETFKSALTIQPQFVDLHYRLGLLYTDRREFEEAVKHMEQASAGAPGNEQIRAGLALSLQNMGLMDQAAATWRSLWKVHEKAGHRS